MKPDSYHYHVMARAIDAIDTADEAPLSLADLAARMNMSPAHFQRLFTAWVGVSPKRYQQYLTLGHAKTLLAERFTTLETADHVGLSGTGRLHDLFLRWEAMSPGEFARAGAGLTIRWGWFESPFGPALVMGTEKGICGIAFAAESGAEPAMADLRARWPRATYVEDPSALRRWVEDAFAGRGEARLHLIGAPFQIKVWEALMRIPSGQVTTYSEIAQAVGHPTAQIGGTGRLSLGAAGQTRHPRLGKRAGRGKRLIFGGTLPVKAALLDSTRTCGILRPPSAGPAPPITRKSSHDPQTREPPLRGIEPRLRHRLCRNRRPKR